VLAAVLLSCGLERTEQVVERVLGPLFEQRGRTRDPKTELQQLFQTRRRTPQYHVLTVAGPTTRAPTSRGPSRRHFARPRERPEQEGSEQAAALAALDHPETVEQALLTSPCRWRRRIRGGASLPPKRQPGCGLRFPTPLSSTSAAPRCPGLEAKPIIDLLVGVPDLSNGVRLPDYESMGEAGLAGRLYFRKRGPVSFNAQVVQHGSPLWQDALLLRDYLCAHPQESERYAEQKRKAIASGATTLLRYSEEKAGVVGELLERARRWSPAR